MKKATILIVEDNPDNMDLIEEILEDEGYAVIKSYRAEEGIATLRENTVDLVIMDISLPKMSGLEAAQLIKAEPATRDIPLLVLTAHARASDRKSAFSAGCNGFLTKPTDEEVLLAAVLKFLS